MAYGHRDSNSSTNSICPKPTLSPHPRQWLKPSRRQAAEHRHRHRHLSATKFHTASTSTGKPDLHHRNHPNASLELANPHEFQPPQSELPPLSSQTVMRRYSTPGVAVKLHSRTKTSNSDFSIEQRPTAHRSRCFELPDLATPEHRSLDSVASLHRPPPKLNDPIHAP